MSEILDLAGVSMVDGLIEVGFVTFYSFACWSYSFRGDFINSLVGLLVLDMILLR